MKYITTGELEHFDFSDAYIGDVQVANGFFHMVLDNVTILPENSCNRDIREMRANHLVLKIEGASIAGIVEEGFKVYDADGKLTKTCEDVQIESGEYAAVAKTFVDGMIYSLEKKEDKYLFCIDAANERTYSFCVTGSGDVEEWDRFLSK